MITLQKIINELPSLSYTDYTHSADGDFESFYAQGHHIRRNEFWYYIDNQRVTDEQILDLFEAFYCSDCKHIYTNDQAHWVEDDTRRVCDSCIDSYYTCDGCGGGLYHEDEMNFYNDHCYCNDCYSERVSYCDSCEDEYDRDDLRTVCCEDGEYRAYCGSCINDMLDNLQLCPNCGAYNERGLDQCLSCGHQFTPATSKKLITYNKVQCYHPHIKLTPIDNYRKIIPINEFKGYGIELEINKDEAEPGMSEEEEFNTVAEINKYLKGHAYYSHDGSLRHGFEIVTQPHTEKAMRHIKWGKLFETLKKENFTDNSIQAGYHIHISKTLFGDSEQEIEDNLAKLIYFFERNKKDLIKISRRQNTTWCPFYTDQNQLWVVGHWGESIKPKLSEQLAKDISSRKLSTFRGAVNLRSKDSATVEIRLFRSTLNYTEFMASFDLITTLVKNVKNITWDKINYNSKWLNGLSTVGRKYLKSKKALGVR